MIEYDEQNETCTCCGASVTEVEPCECCGCDTCWHCMNDDWNFCKTCVEDMEEWSNNE